uniref:Uncharacterized protein n=1 Tax=Acrobeloides nanus TaxID=290746 RepID=A0A914CSQ2_9BILA
MCVYNYRFDEIPQLFIASNILDKRNFEFIWDTERNKVFWTETQIVGQFSWTFSFIPQLFQKEPWVHVSVHCNRDNKNPNWSCAAEFCLAIKENEVAHRDRHYVPKVLHFMRTWSAKQNPWTFYFTSWKNLEENYFTDGKKLNIEGWISVHEAFGANLASILAESDMVNKTIKDLQLTNEDLKFKLNSVTRELNRMTEERDVLAKKLYPLKEHVKEVELKLERYVTEQEHINNHIQSTEERDIIISELQETIKIKDVEIYRVGNQLTELHEMLMNLRIENGNHAGSPVEFL